MIKRKTKCGIMLCLAAILLLSGCWDQNLLKEVRIFLVAGMDLMEDGKIKLQVSTPILKREQQGGGTVTGFRIFSGVGHTPREARGEIDRKTSRSFEGSKLRVLIIGSELAKKDIYSVLDVFFRDPRSSLSAKVIIADERASDLMKIDLKEEKLSDYYYHLLKSQEEVSLIPEENIQSICAELFDPGEDFTLPLVSRKDEESAYVEGIALFKGKKYTGYNLKGDKAPVFLLMDNNYGKKARFTKKLKGEKENSLLGYVSFDVKNASRKLDVEIRNGKVEAKIDLKLKINLTDYPRNKLFMGSELKKLNKMLSDLLTKDAEEAIKTLQKADSDALGIGRRVIALYHEYWKTVKWDEEYQNIKITPKVTAKITGYGIIE